MIYTSYVKSMVPFRYKGYPIMASFSKESRSLSTYRLLVTSPYFYFRDNGRGYYILNYLRSVSL